MIENTFSKGTSYSYMSILTLQTKKQELSDQITDILYAIQVNLNVMTLQITKPISTTHTSLQSDIESDIPYLKELLEDIKTLWASRQQEHLNHLITRQIQEEEDKVHKERLYQYEEKIYDLRRIISDKEGFLEALLNPRNKKEPGMTNEEYMEMRYRLREEDEKQKKAALTELIAEMMEFRTMLSTHLDKKINDGLEDTKSSLVGSTNLSIVDNLEITDRIGTLTNLQTHDLQKANDSGNKQNCNTHLDVKCQKKIEVNSFKIVPEWQSEEALKIAQNIRNIVLKRQSNAELQKSYELATEMSHFRQQNNRKLQERYKQLTAIRKQSIANKQKAKKIHTRSLSDLQAKSVEI